MKTNLKLNYAMSAFICLLIFGLGVNAAVLTVTNGGDTNDAVLSDGVCADSANNCTLRAAVQEANALAGDDTINFSGGLNGATIALTLGEITIGNNGALVINGLGANLLTVSGNNASRVFVVQAGAAAQINRLSVANGRNQAINGTGGTNGNPGLSGGAGNQAAGGAIVNNGTLRLTTVTVRDSAAIGGNGGNGGNGTNQPFVGSNGGSGGSGGAALGGGIQNTGVLYLFGCTVSGNQTTAGRGGNGGGGGSGAADSGDGGSGGNGAIASGNIHNTGTLFTTNSTVTNNQATGGIGGIGGSGTPPGQNGLNGAAFGGGFFNAGSGSLRLINATVSHNNAANGGGGISNSGGTINLGNTLVADNVSTGSISSDVSGTVNSLGYNLVENTSGTTFTGDTTGNKTGVDPILGALQNNGGETLTRALLNGSPAIDAGSNALAVNPDNGQPLTLDQRGVQRSTAVNSATAVTDIGAFEALPPSAAPVSLGGRVFNGKGSGIIRRAQIVLLDTTTGVERATRADERGFYQFDELEIGRFYIVRAASENFRFAPGSYFLELTETREDINFTGDRQLPE